MANEDVDILQIDKTIQNTLAQQSKPIPIHSEYHLDELSYPLRKKLENHLSQYSNPHSNISSSNSLIHSNQDIKNFYLLDTVELIQEYKETLKTPIKISFMTNTTIEPPPNTPEKNNIIQSFIERIKSYDDTGALYLNNPSHIPEQRCIHCNSTNITESIEFEGIMICLDCGSQETTLNLANSIRINHNDSKRINICSKYSYDKKSHFLNCINQYQGRHKSGVDPDIIQAIIRELDKYNLIDHSQTQKTDKYKNVSKEHILLFVKELRLTKCYGDVNLIHHLITGYPLNDISHLTEKLLQDFDQFVQMHYKLFPNDMERKNFNYQHLLYQLLMRHKYPCNPAEFNFLKTIDRKYYHDEICRSIFENLGWNYSSLF